MMDKMRKLFLILTVPVFLFLSACGTGSLAPTMTNPPKVTSVPTHSIESLCQKISLEPTPDAKESSLFPAVSDTDYVIGPKDAAMTIIEYGDFQ